MKRLLFFAFLSLSCYSLKAQSHRFSIGLAGGFVQNYFGTQNQSNLQGGFGAAFDYYLTDFMTAGMEGQKGKIITGNPESQALHYYSVNYYQALNVNLKMNLKVIKNIRQISFLRYFQGLYLGAGAGIVKNDVQEISRLNSYNPQTKKYELTPVDETGIYWTLPIQAGIDFQVNRKEFSSLLIGLNTQLNIVPHGRMDGYVHHFNSGPGIYGFNSVSVKYRLSRRHYFNKNVFPRTKIGK